uniref:BZIP domain-containing protein n=1 Tax=Romanomermis culicivorax TaxID=13658 RepID=A0A915IZQ9_ROMCU
MLSMNQFLPPQNVLNGGTFATYSNNNSQQQFTDRNFDQYHYNVHLVGSSSVSSNNNNNNSSIGSLTPPISPENLTKFPLNLATSERTPYRNDIVAQPNTVPHFFADYSTSGNHDKSTLSCAKNLFSANRHSNNIEDSDTLNGLETSSSKNFQPPNSLNSLLSHELLLIKAAHQIGPGPKKSVVSRSQRKPIPFEQRDDKYFERRRRNNAAAKKSRDNRKYREGENAVRAAHLQQENAVLRAEKATLEEELQKLRALLMHKEVQRFNTDHLINHR